MLDGKRGSLKAINRKKIMVELVNLVDLSTARALHKLDLPTHYHKARLPGTATTAKNSELYNKFLDLPEEDFGAFTLPERFENERKPLFECMVKYASENNYNMCSFSDRSQRTVDRAIYCYEQALSEAFQREIKFDIMATSGQYSLTTTHSSTRRVLGVHFDDDSVPIDNIELVRFVINLRSTARHFLLLPIPLTELKALIDTEDISWSFDVAQEAFEHHNEMLVLTIPPKTGIYCKTRKYLHDGWVRQLAKEDEYRDAVLFLYGSFDTVK